MRHGIRLGRYAALWSATWLLSACGGTHGNAPQQTKPVVYSESGTLYTGVPSLDGGSFADILASGNIYIYIKGVAGLHRFVIPSSAATYTVKLDQLTGPYAIGTQLFEPDQPGTPPDYLMSLATKPGTANLTPLTTLVVAQVFGLDPSKLFPNLATTGDARLAPVTDAHLAVAQDKVVRYLKEQFGFVVPAGLGDFITAPFAAKNGDPMFDTLLALNARFATLNTNFLRVGAQIARHAALCQQEQLTLTQGGASQDFCPATKNAVRDENDPSLITYTFTTESSTVLSVVGRDSVVLSVTLQQKSADAFTCTGVACANVVLGAAAADGSRTITFTAAALSDSTSSIAIDGAARAVKPGPILPTVACTDNRYFIIYPDDRVAATCAAPDSVLGFGFGSVSPAGGTRRIYSFTTDGSVSPPPSPLEVRADGVDGREVLSVLVQDLDPDTGAARMFFKCRGSDCNGVTIGPARDDVDSFAPYIIRSRSITLEDTLLDALNLDGTPAPTGPATVRASVDSLEVIAPDSMAQSPAPCASQDQRLTAQRSDDPQPIDVCPPATLPDGLGLTSSVFLFTTLDGGANAGLFIGSLYADTLGNASYAGDSGGVHINLHGDAIADATFSLYGTSVVFRCIAAACLGLDVSAPDASGSRIVRASGTLLQEMETGGLPGDRTVTLNGGFVAPPPPP